ncbi:MAG: glutamate racemase [Acidimicrobiia bacterium]
MIGVFDSGVGGLSVLREIRALAPNVDLLYVADRDRAPYGNRSLDEVRSMAHEIAAWLVDRGAETIVVACNTASAAALDSLREWSPGIPIVGMEPAVKPAAATSETEIIGVFATEATFQGRLFESVVSTHAPDAKVVTQACPDWVELVEQGRFSGPDVDTAIVAAVVPVIDQGADVLVLGCTHFSFLRRAIAKIAGPGITLIDPAPAVAAQTIRVAGTGEGQGRLGMAASGDRSVFAQLARDVGIVDWSGEVLPFPA